MTAARPLAGTLAPGARRLWLFNLDAELELASHGPYQTAKHVARTLQPVLSHAQKLMAPGDAWLDDLAASGEGGATAPRPAFSGWVGRAWCPTPSAARRLSRAGAQLEPGPALEVLRRVNHRRFALELGGGAPHARYITTEADLAPTLREASSAAWLFKKPFGFAGRGQRRIVGEPSKDDRRWLDDALRHGGFLAEPWLEIERELSLHGLLDARGEHTLGRVCVQQTDRFRAWASTALAGSADIEPAQTAALRGRAESVADALAAAGYFGPFGIDAYLWRTAQGKLQLNPLSELNARYTMGYSVGMR